FERFRTIDVTSVFQFARVDAQIPVSCFDSVLEFIECETLVRCQRADNSQTQTLVNHSINFVSTMRRPAVNATQFLLFSLSLPYFAHQRSLFSHRPSSQ